MSQPTGLQVKRELIYTYKKMCVYNLQSNSHESTMFQNACPHGCAATPAPSKSPDCHPWSAAPPQQTVNVSACLDTICCHCQVLFVKIYDSHINKPSGLQHTASRCNFFAYKSSSFYLLQRTIYNWELQKRDLQTYNIFTNYVVGPTAQNSLNLQPTFDVTPPFTRCLNLIFHSIHTPDRLENLQVHF